VILLIAVIHMLGVCGFAMLDWFALDVGKMDLGQMHRLNTYPLVHVGLLHALLNILALTPLLERFEREVGTLKTLLLVLGPLVTFPGGLYVGIEILLLGAYDSVAGASALVFTLMANEAVKTFLEKPTYSIAGYGIPSWMAPIFWLVVVSILVPGASILGHFCGLIIGYLYACHYLRLLEPSENILGKVESKLNFITRRVPFYISLENRTEMNHMELLPTSISSRTQSTSRATTSIPMESGSGFAAAGPGRVLGS
jgi:membrane associated rhomboid family serine protease